MADVLCPPRKETKRTDLALFALFFCDLKMTILVFFVVFFMLAEDIVGSPSLIVSREFVVLCSQNDACKKTFKVAF